MRKSVAVLWVLAATITVDAADAWARQAKPAAPSAQAPAESPMKVRPVPQSAEWDKLKTLVGEWEWRIPSVSQVSNLEIRLIGDGSALMHLMDRGTPHEMITMIHPDGKRLVATHYCAAHNQPRMALVPSGAPNQVSFDFIDGTNIAPGEGHMRRLTITFVDADHHEAAWTFGTAEKQMPMEVFRYTRKK